MADKIIKALIAEAVRGNTWQKFANPSAARGKTAFPKTSADQEKYGIRFDYDTVISKEGTDFHTFKMQPNKGKIPSSIKTWRDKNGTDAVMATVWVKTDASAEEVEAALEAAREDFKNSP
ncbi:hypothetical protein C0995_005758 [Termitomyces sp. Mi166|nr:hypothetical protein C0995_005758 [Termitomyces sp. Mi166\